MTEPFGYEQVGSKMTIYGIISIETSYNNFCILVVLNQRCVKIILEEMKTLFGFSTISQQWRGVGTFSWKKRTCLSYTLNTIVVDDLVVQGTNNHANGLVTPVSTP